LSDPYFWTRKTVSLEGRVHKRVVAVKRDLENLNNREFTMSEVIEWLLDAVEAKGSR
jgi:hypothetical protein